MLEKIMFGFVLMLLLKLLWISYGYEKDYHVEYVLTVEDGILFRTKVNSIIPFGFETVGGVTKVSYQTFDNETKVLFLKDDFVVVEEKIY